jgi:hypothetical protein
MRLNILRPKVGFAAKDRTGHSRAYVIGSWDSTAIWFIQCVGSKRHLIDYYESSGASLHHYADVLHEKQAKYRWRYAQHWLPHDVKHRELNTAMSRIETLRR